MSAMADRKDPVHRAFGNRLRTARLLRGLQVSELASLAATETGTISRYEAGERRSPDPYILQRVTQALDITIEWLLTGKGRRPKAPKTAAPGRA